MTAVELLRTSHGPGERLAAHRHRSAYVALVLRGGYEEIGPDGAWSCEAGDLVVHPPFHLHGDLMHRRGARVLNFVLPLSPTVLGSLSSYAVVRSWRPGRIERAAARDPLAALAEALEDGQSRARCANEDWRARIAERIAAAPRKRVGRLVEEEGVSAAHASRAFRARYGIGPAQFRAEQRLRRALRALADTGAPLVDVAQAAGFTDQAHMSRAVRAVTGMSPSRLRAALGRPCR